MTTQRCFLNSLVTLSYKTHAIARDKLYCCQDEPRLDYSDGSSRDLHAANHGLNNSLSSITELRSKGESRRFLDEVGYLFEGLTPESSLGVRRSSALEVVTKLCDADFLRRAKAADFLSRAWELLRSAGAGDGDKVCPVYLMMRCPSNRYYRY